MDKKRNLTLAAKGLESPLFVQDRENNIAVFIVDEKDYMEEDYDGLINCQVLEYEEKQSEIVYRRKTPELIIPLPRKSIEALYLT